MYLLFAIVIYESSCIACRQPAADSPAGSQLYMIPGHLNLALTLPQL